MIKNEEPLVSIITPCYNVEQYISEFIRSVIKQNYDNIELVLINDGSSDKTKEIILSHKQIIKERGYKFILINQENLGVAEALNSGLAVFNGELFTWPDADDILSNDNIRIKVEFLRKYQKIGMVRGRRLFFTEDISKSNNIYDKRNGSKKLTVEDLIKGKTFINGGCYMIRRELFFKCYPERRIFPSKEGQNYQLVIPAASKTECGYIDKPIFYIRESDGTHSRQERTVEKWFERYCEIEKIMVNAIAHANCEREKYKSLAKRECLRKKFNTAIKYGNRKSVKELYEELKQKRFLTLGIRYKYIKAMMK
ncbi:MAG: glycosyltransferase family 2 protein [bacterium]